MLGPLIEDPEDYISRAVAMLRDSGQTQGCIDRNMRVAFLVSRFTEDPIPVAGAWLMELGKVIPGFDAVCAREFGFAQAALYRRVDEWKPEELEKYFAEYPNEATMGTAILLAAVLLDELRIRALQIRPCDDLILRITRFLESTPSLQPYLAAVMAADLARIKLYRETVLGTPPEDTPMLSNGLPSTLGVWKMLATMTWGAQSAAVRSLEDLIETSELGISEPVRTEESAVIQTLARMV